METNEMQRGKKEKKRELLTVSVVYGVFLRLVCRCSFAY